MTSPRSDLRAFVQQSGVHVKQLADALGMSRAYLYLLMDESSEQLPSRTKAAALEEIAGIPQDAWNMPYVAVAADSKRAA